MIPLLFTETICRHHCENNGWDWVTAVIKVFSSYKLISTYITDPIYTFHVNHFLPILYLKNITLNQPDEKIQSFFDRVFTSIFRCAKQGEKDDTIIVTSFKNFEI